MLGHKVWQEASTRHETWATVRTVTPAMRVLGLGDPSRTLTDVDVRDPRRLEAALDAARPDVVVNCVGLIKQLGQAKDPVLAITINALHPHVLAAACASRGCRLIHISTDCVFDGVRGGYREQDRPDASDLYGRSKALGETTADGCLTLRTSIIGRELSGASGLTEWFLSRRGGSAAGFRRAVFSGLSTLELARVILDVVERHPQLAGLYHVSADPIDKHRLLQLLSDAYGADVAITPQDEPVIDRSLDSTRFRETTGYAPPSWPDMVAAMAADATPYDRARQAG